MNLNKTNSEKAHRNRQNRRKGFLLKNWILLFGQRNIQEIAHSPTYSALTQIICTRKYYKNTQWIRTHRNTTHKQKQILHSHILLSRRYRYYIHSDPKKKHIQMQISHIFRSLNYINTNKDSTDIERQILYTQTL